VNRHNPWMLEPGGDLRFQEETGLALGIARMTRLDLLESHFAVQFEVLGHEDLTQAPAGMGARDPVAQRGCRGFFAGRCMGERGLGSDRRARGQAGQGRLDLAIAQPLELLLQRRLDRQRRQALPGIVLVRLEVFLDQGMEELKSFGAQIALAGEDLAERLGLVEHPGLHRGHQALLADELHLEGEHAEKQIAVGSSRSRRSRIGHGTVLQPEEMDRLLRTLTLPAAEAAMKGKRQRVPLPMLAGLLVPTLGVSTHGGAEASRFRHRNFTISLATPSQSFSNLPSSKRALTLPPSPHLNRYVLSFFCGATRPEC